MQHFHKIGRQQNEESNEEKVEMFLRGLPKSSKEINTIIGLVSKFVRMKGITHYVSAVSLGAVEYSTSIVEESRRNSGVGAGVDIKGAGAGFKGNAANTSTEEASNTLMIGDIASAKHGRGESVIEYKLQPIFTLICNKHGMIKRVLQCAVQHYIEENSKFQVLDFTLFIHFLVGGPYKVSCGYRFKNFWKVATNSYKEELKGTTSKTEASHFFVETSLDNPEAFNIAYYGENNSDEGRCSRYLITDSRFTGKDNGPLEMCELGAGNFVLEDGKGSRILSTYEWEEDPCYIRVAPRKIQRKSYLGYNEESCNSICRPKIKNNRKKSCWFRFKLNRVNIEQLRPQVNFDDDVTSLTCDCEVQQCRKRPLTDNTEGRRSKRPRLCSLKKKINSCIRETAI